MLIEAITVPDGAVLEFDLCIVGAGAVGITIARALSATRHRVCLLESGGLDEEAASQELAKGDSVGVPYFALDETLFRVFGGSTARWDGWCRPLDPMDFRHRSWVPHSGWPISAAELDDYYRRAQAVCDLPTFRYHPGDWSGEIPPLYRPPFVGRTLRTVIWQKASPPTRFGSLYRDDIKQATNITAYLHANVVRIRVNRERTLVRELDVATLDGPKFAVRARCYVVATGGIEAPRLLLSSNIGNDLVGRFFMEHPHVSIGRVQLDQTTPGARPQVAAIDRGWSGALARLALERPKGGIKCAYALTHDVQEQRQILNLSAHLRGVGQPSDPAAARLASGMRSPLRTLRRMPLRGRYSVPTQLRQFLRSLPTTLAEGYDRFIRRPRQLELYCRTEQAPNPDSRVTLSGERDVFGVPRVKLDWRLAEIDKRTVRESLMLIGDELARTGVGAVEPEPWVLSDDDDWGPSLRGGHHHMGTTRMSEDPTTGVLDPNCRVHGMDNLYISGPSVFPTGGFSNPLLTAVALALRTADHVKRELSGPRLRRVDA